MKLSSHKWLIGTEANTNKHPLFGKTATLIFIALWSYISASAQISPGDLSLSHSHLEGISNCTQCHVLADKVSNENCLKCHTEIQNRINLQKGYHASMEVKGKQCINCHSEHNGRNFQLYRLNIESFNHNLTGYPLSTPHAQKECRDCHNPKYIADQKLKAKKNTYLGVGPGCLNCHTDYHRKTLSQDCLNCHNPNAFKPASKFNHANARFKLLGKHTQVDCQKCHKVEMTEGKKFQQFRGIQYSNCNNCHQDPHQNQFGQNCRQCHSEVSFQVVASIKNFDHNKTNFKLEGKHLNVNCKSCHKSGYTVPIKHDRCADCHSDYHNSQFAKNGVSPDCRQCHSMAGFAVTSYTVEQHSMGSFPLKGGHMAIPCSDCHKKQEKWSFRNIGSECKDCHQDIHQGIIQPKYYPGATCTICHNENRWTDLAFDHSKTGFNLTGAHTRQECRSCHFTKDTYGSYQQRFSGLSQNCSGCHSDNHFKQFEKNGITNCATCHDAENWKIAKFDHDKTAFKLEGKHIGVPCVKCHKPQQVGSAVFVQYKLKEFKCESCHL
jgi:hypothetical protein